MPYPETTHLTFDRAMLQESLTLGTPDGDVPDMPGYWLILRNNDLIAAGGDAAALPFGPPPTDGPWRVPPVFVGTYLGRPLRAARLEPEASIPPPFRPLSAAYRDLALSDHFQTLAGLARQILHWRDRSRVCPACGGSPREIPGSWGARCPSCAREYYPRLHPAVIVLVRRGEEFLMVRKPEWPDGQYGLVAGFVEFCESLEECVAREVLEETGIRVADVRYAASQNWPFPSQLMVGFTAAYAGGDLRPDGVEIADAAWFSAHRPPPLLPPRSTIARHLFDRFLPGIEQSIRTP